MQAPQWSVQSYHMGSVAQSISKNIPFGPAPIFSDTICHVLSLNSQASRGILLQSAFKAMTVGWAETPFILKQNFHCHYNEQVGWLEAGEDHEDEETIWDGDGFVR